MGEVRENYTAHTKTVNMAEHCDNWTECMIFLANFHLWPQLYFDLSDPDHIPTIIKCLYMVVACLAKPDVKRWMNKVVSTPEGRHVPWCIVNLMEQNLIKSTK